MTDKHALIVRKMDSLVNIFMIKGVACLRMAAKRLLIDALVAGILWRA
jgi:hypothetical protein